jgi:hypothetical protein
LTGLIVAREPAGAVSVSPLRRAGRASLLFWAVNGYLLGREYFETVAHAAGSARQGAVALRRANAGTVWLAGALMAAPLSLPLVNLFVPVLGVGDLHPYLSPPGRHAGLTSGRPAGAAGGRSRGHRSITAPDRMTPAPIGPDHDR